MKIGFDRQSRRMFEFNAPDQLYGLIRRRGPSVEIIEYSDPSISNPNPNLQWNWPTQKARLLSSGPMAGQAWLDPSLDLDLLITFSPLDTGVALPGNAPCLSAAYLSANEVVELMGQQTMPPCDRATRDRNLRGNRLRGLRQFDLIFLDFDPNEMFGISVDEPPTWMDSEKIVLFNSHNPPDLKSILARFDSLPPSEPGASGRPALAMVGPTPPVAGGVARWNWELATRLAREFELTVFVDDLPARVLPIPGATIAHHTRLERWRSERIAANAKHDNEPPIFYTLGNGDAFHFVFRWMRRLSGFVQFHDLPPAAFGMHESNYWMNRIEWERLIEAEHGESIRELRRRGPVETLPMTRTFVGSARGCVAHNEYSAAQIREAKLGVPVWVAPLPCPPASAPSELAAARQAGRRALGLDDDAIVVAHVGMLNPQKRLDVALAGFAEARSREPRLRLLIAGGGKPAEFRALFAQAERLGIADATDILDALADEPYRALMAAADIAINLRWPSHGESSGTLAEWLALGVPTLVSDAGPTADLPAICAVKIPLGETEIDAIRDALLGLIEPSSRRTIAAAAQAHAANNSWDRYVDIIRDALRM